MNKGKWKKRLSSRGKAIFTPFLLFIFLISFNPALEAEGEERFLVRITSSPKEMEALSRFPLDFVSMALEKAYRDAVVTQKELEDLLARGYRIEILQRESDLIGLAIDPLYHTYEETVEYLRSIVQLYPHLTRLFYIGKSTLLGYPIWAIKISDNPEQDEGELAVLVDGMHHAREPLGNEICLSFLDYLLSRYGWDERVTSWVNDYEIWIVPIMNPEGYKYITDNNLSSPWWRKNLRDNNHNKKIDSNYDGVDLNRNYDFNWTSGGSVNPADWTYRGPGPFSEKETQAKRDLALKKKFVASITYHSYGEVVLYQWAWPGSGAKAPDHELITKMASEIAKRIKDTKGTGTYTYERQTAANQSGPWMYGNLGTLEFLIEVGASFIPPGPEIKGIVESNLEGLFYLLERLKGPGIKGRILDGLTGLPLEATVIVGGIDNLQYIQPRKSDPVTGRFVRLLEPGKYTLLILAPRHNIRAVSVDIDSTLKDMDIYLYPDDDRRPGIGNQEGLR